MILLLLCLSFLGSFLVKDTLRLPVGMVDTTFLEVCYPDSAILRMFYKCVEICSLKTYDTVAKHIEFKVRVPDTVGFFSIEVYAWKSSYSGIATYSLQSIPSRVMILGDTLVLAQSVDGVLTSKHGSGSWITGGISGSYTVKVYVLNTVDSSAIGNCEVNIKNKQGNLLALLSTNASGVISFSCDADTYLLQKEKYGFSPSKFYDTLVVNSNLVDTVWMTAFVPPTPSAGNLCTVYGFVYDPIGRALKDVEVRARVSEYPTWIDSVGVVISYVADTTDTNGYWMLELYRTGKYIVEIPLMGYSKKITVPNQASVNLKNL